MPMDGTRFNIERQKLCTWLEAEKRKADILPSGERGRRTLELEKEFRARLDRLYDEVRGEYEPAKKN